MSDIIVGSVGVRLVPNAEGFAAKTKALTQGLAADVRVNLDDKDARARLDMLGRPRDAKINASADTAKASAQLDAAAHDRKVNFEARGLSAMVTGVAALGPALVPVTAAAAGLVAALGAPIAAGVGGLGLYGLIAGKAVADTEKQSKAIDQLKKKVDAAQVSLQKASTPAGKESALATLAADTTAYNKALNGLNPAQAQFLRAQGAVKSAFTDLERTAGPSIFGPLTSAMTTLSTLMPKVAPVLKPVSDALKGLLDEVAQSARSGALDDFTKFLAATAGPTITTAGHTLGNIALGFAAIGKAFAPLGSSLGDAVLHWSESFAKIGQSKGLADFVGYVRKEGPQVASTLGHVAGAIGHIATALAPIGDLSLKGIDGLAKGVSKIPTGVLSAAAISFASIALSMKAISLGSKGLGALSKVGSLVGLGGKAGGLATVEGALGKVGAKGVVPVYVTGGHLTGAGIPGIPGEGGPRRVPPAIPIPKGGKDGFFGFGEHLFNVTESGVKATLSAALGKAAGDGIFKTLLKGLLAPPAWITAGDAGHEVLTPKAAPFTPGKWALDDAKKNAAAMRDQQAALDSYLSDLRGLGKVYSSLPKKVQTQIATPGAVTSLSDVSRLAQQYHLTPKQVRTVIELANAGKVKADAAAIGRLYGLTPKQVRTLISQAGMDSSQAQIRRLASLYHLTPKQVRTIVTADTSNAAGAIARIRSMLAGIPRSISTAYYVNQINSVSKAPLNFSPTHGKAYGGSVPKDGGPYADRYPYLLAPGEEVISNKHGQADRNRALLKAINAGRLAEGGTAGWGMPSWAGGWKMPQQAPSPGIWFQQIIADWFKAHHAPVASNGLADEIRKLTGQIKSSTGQASELSKARKGESKEQKAAREREVKALQAHEKVLQKHLDALKAQQAAVKAFSLSSVLPTIAPTNPIWAGTKAQLDTFQHDLTKAGGTWTGAMQDHAHRMLHDALSLDKATRAQDAATTAAQDQKSALDALKQTMQQFGDSVSGLFRSGLFGLTDANGAPMASSVSGILSTLTGDTANATKFTGLLSQLSGEGLDKGVLSELASKGDMGSASVLAGASASDIASINAAASSRDSALGLLSTGSASDVYGTQFAAQVAAVTKADADVKATAAQTAQLINALTQEVRELKAIAGRPIVLDGEVVHHSVTKRNQTVTRTTGKNPLASLPGSR